MENRLNVKNCLKIFNAVQSKGEKQGDSYTSQGFEAWSDFDGYTCFLRYKQTTLTLMFHGKYQLECPNEEAFAEFERKLLMFKS